MTDLGIADLHYGHFGQPVYDVENMCWVFKRVPGLHRVLHPLGSRHLEAPATISTATCEVSSAAKLDAQKGHLLKMLPEFETAGPLLGRLAQVSNAIEAVTSLYDPLVGDLLACGRTVDVDNNKPIAFVALPGGAAGESLRLVRQHVERHGWSPDHSVWLRVPTICHGDVGWWAGSGTPILQIASSVCADGHRTLLAARTARSITIIQPRYHRVCSAPQNTQAPSSFPPSRMEACPLASLRSNSREPAYAHVAFNPWCKRQFAMIDIEGNWSVYNLEGRRGIKSSYRLVHSTKGSLAPPLAASDIRQGTLPGSYDGWGRVMWVVSGKTILACNRRVVKVADFHGQSIYLSPSSLRLAGSSSWILDVRSDPHDPARILVLTSTHLLLVKLSALMTLEEGKGWADANVLLSWRHFIHEEDTTMRINSFADLADTVVLLQPRGFLYAIIFRYRPHDDLDVIVSVSDPATFLHCHSSLRGLHVMPLEFGQDHRAIKCGPGDTYRNSGLRFFNFLLLSTTMEASRLLVVVSDQLSGSLTRQRASLGIKTPSWTKRTAWQSCSRVVDDAAPEPDIDADSKDPCSAHGPQATTHARLRAVKRRTKMLTNLNKLLAAMDSIDDRTREDYCTTIAEIRSRIGSMDPEDCCPSTIYRLTGRDLSNADVGDIDEAAASFADLVNSALQESDERPSLAIKHLGGASFIQFEDGVPSISHTHRELVRRHVWTEPSSLPERDRLAKERLSRRLAVASCLACVKLEVRHPDSGQAMDEALEPMQDDHLRVYRSPGPDYTETASYALPSPEATPSLASEGPLITTTFDMAHSSGLKRLRQFGVTCGHDNLQIPDLPASGKQILAQWTAPEAYQAGWKEGGYVYGRGMRMSALDDASLSAKQRQRLLKKEEKRARKQRREIELYRLSVSQAPQLTIISQSQPQPACVMSSPTGQRPINMSQSSQPRPSTQIERGVHGGRPGKKRRRDGF